MTTLYYFFCSVLLISSWFVINPFYPEPKIENPAETRIDTIYNDISVADAYNKIQQNLGNPNFVILDVRTPSEYAPEHIANSKNIDYNSPGFSNELDKLDKHKAYLVYCKSGSRSKQACNIMHDKGFIEIYNMLGGITGWKGAGYPVTDEVTEIESGSIQFTEGYTIFPNPCKEYLVISGDNFPVDMSVEFFGMNGQKIICKTYKYSPTQIKLDISSVTKGLYIIRIKAKEHTEYTKLIVE